MKEKKTIRPLTIEEKYELSSSKFEYIIRDFDKVNALLERQLEEYTFDEMNIVARFYIKSSSTNVLIYQASKLAETDVALLEEYNIQLHKKIERYKAIDKTRFLQMDFATPVDDYLGSLMKEFNRAAVESGTHFQEVYTPMKDKLASLDPSTSEYQTLYKEFQEVEAKQKVLTATAKKANNMQQDEGMRYGLITLFKPILLEILVQKLDRISQKITIDLKSAEEVGDE